MYVYIYVLYIYISISLFLSFFFLYLQRSCSVGHVAPSLLAHRRSVENYHRRAQFIRPERAVSRQLQYADESDDDAYNTPLCQPLASRPSLSFEEDARGLRTGSSPGPRCARSRSSRGTVASRHRHVTSITGHSRSTNLTHPEGRQETTQRGEHRLRNPRDGEDGFRRNRIPLNAPRDHCGEATRYQLRPRPRRRRGEDDRNRSPLSERTRDRLA